VVRPGLVAWALVLATGWWALGEGKSSYGDKEVLDRIRESHPELVGKYKEAYKARRDARFDDVFKKAAE
jgi:hypothetical protein